jgi:hypothetical protein
LCLAATAVAAVPAPPPPDVYDVRIHFRIDAFRTQRVAQFDEMMRFLQAHGFRRDPNEEIPEDEAENPAYTVLHGSVPAKQALELLGERHVKTILLVPQRAKLPEDKDERVRVDLRLAQGFAPEFQRVLHDQARAVLASIQFRAAVAYDHQSFTRLVGSMPTGQLDKLLTDLRKLPAGQKQAAPFASVWPLPASEVLVGMALPGARPGPPVVPPGQEKLTADLREVVADAAPAATPRRLEVLLAATPELEDRAWVRRLTGRIPGLVVEGRVGPLVSVVLPPAQAPAVAALDQVVAVRLPRVARSGSQHPGGNDETWKPLLEASGVARLHDMRHKGGGVRVAILDSDFAGWQALVGKQLPAGTHLIDVTAERNRNLMPDPSPPGSEMGPGTRRAVTFSRAAPEADLTLIRVDPAAPYMVYQVARAINGDPYLSVSLDSRLAELQADRRVLDGRRAKLLQERKEVFGNFELEGEPARRREQYLKDQAALDRDEADHYQRIKRFLQLQDDLQRLKAVRLVASGLAWDEGYPVDGDSTLTRYFDDRPFRNALWFQAAGDTRGQSWVGMFRDADGNGVMEFSPPGARLPAGAWTPELNFLAWRGEKQQQSLDLPAKARLRISLQWREAHESLHQRVGEDPYREPLARLRLVVLFQPDPVGKRRPADDLEVVAQSAGLPQRLAQTPTSGTYEQTVELVVPRAGRYVVRIEGKAPEGILPPSSPTIPAIHKEGELRVRLFVTTLHGAGRAVWLDHATETGSLGIPADARAAITTGAANVTGRPQPYSVVGTAFDLALLPKPDVFAFDNGAGTADAAAFGAGVAASVLSAGGSRADLLRQRCFRPGSLMRVTTAGPAAAYGGGAGHE